MATLWTSYVSCSLDYGGVQEVRGLRPGRGGEAGEGLPDTGRGRCAAGRRVAGVRRGEALLGRQEGRGDAPGRGTKTSRVERQLGADFLSKLEEIWHRLDKEWRRLRFGRNREFTTFHTMSKL